MEKLLEQAGACTFGCVAVEKLRSHMSEAAWQRAQETTPGLRNLEPEGPGWRKLDEGGSASLWEFTGCDA